MTDQIIAARITAAHGAFATAKAMLRILDEAAESTSDRMDLQFAWERLRELEAAQ